MSSGSQLLAGRSTWHPRRGNDVADRPSASTVRRAATPWLVGILGVALSVTAAVGWRAQAQDQVQRSFDAEAAAVGSAVTTSLLRMDDLSVQARALITSYPRLSNRGLADWYASVGGASRYPGILSFGYIEFVPASMLRAFRHELSRDPIPGSSATPGSLDLGSYPPSRVFCLARLGVAAALNRFVTDPTLDYCSLPGFSALPQARDSGQFVAFTLGEHNVAVFAPVYSG